VRFKDGYGPVGAWFLLFKAAAKNAFGGNYMVERKDELANWAPYGTVKPIPANLRNYLGMLDVLEGKGPIYMMTHDAIQKIASEAGDEKAAKKKLKELEAEAWEDFLDMTISQAILWAGTNTQPEEKPSEIAAAEPYFIGSHSGASGAWVSGPEDLQTDATKAAGYFWGYANMATVKGMFCAGDASGASSHKFSSGSHAEGRIAAKGAVKYIVDNNNEPNIDDAQVQASKDRLLKPLDLFEQNKGGSSDPDINPNYIKPKMFMFRLQKIMDEYCGGVSAQFATNKNLLERGMELLQMLKEDSENLAAEDLHELMRCWENVQRMWQAEAHLKTVLFREETRWPGYYFRSDFPKILEDWKVFANCKVNPETGEWEMIKREIVDMI
jgi:adenylylsulfate reductase subunit A